MLSLLPFSRNSTQMSDGNVRLVAIVRDSYGTVISCSHLWIIKTLPLQGT